MKPLYFGPLTEPLFGIHTPPEGESAPRGVVVICHPFGPEYERAHRALRQLASRLAETRYHAFRFDYFGCGDSAGDTEHGAVSRWVEDIRSATHEAEEETGFNSVTLVGLRLGASLAALAGASGLSIDRLILWDPIVSGTSYLEELARRHLTYVSARPGWSVISQADMLDEVLGAPLPPPLREGMARIDLLALARSPARRILVLVTGEDPAAEALTMRLRQLGSATDLELMRAHPLWQEEAHRTLVPLDVIRRICDWLNRNEE